MKDYPRISGFADEISPDFDTQLRVLDRLGLHWLSLRSADGKSIADYTVAQAKEKLLPRLQAAGVGVSSIGAPTGKVGVEDEAGFADHLARLETMCQIANLLDCRFLRMFSFYIPVGQDPDQYRETVIARLRQFAAVAEKYGITLLHENEKDIYGDTGRRCRDILDAVGSDHFKAIFDFANFVQCGEDTLACWELLKKDVAYIHVKDAVTAGRENVLCGTGEGHIAEILTDAFAHGYDGFLTLEPHLVLFDALKGLETADTKDIIKKNKYADGAAGYEAQYRALCGILDAI